MNPSDASKPQSRSGSSAQDQSAPEETTELLIRVPLRDQDAPDDGNSEPSAAPPAKSGGAKPADKSAPSPGKQADAADQARPLFARVSGSGTREAGPEGVDRVRTGPPPEPEAATRIRFARLHLRTGSLMTARVQYEALAATGDLDLPGLLDLAEVRWRTADLPGAGAAAQEYLSKNGDQALGFLIAAEAAARGGRQVEARRSAEIAAERLAKDLDAVFGGLPRRFNWAGISGGPTTPPVAIKIETPAKPEPKAAEQQGAPKMVSPEALWAQIVEVAQAADQAGQISDEKPALPEPKPEAKAGTEEAAEPEAKAEPAPEAAAPKPEAEAKAEPAPEAAAPKPEAEAKAEPAPEAAAPEAEAEAKAEPKPEAEAKAEPAPEAAAPEPKPEPEAKAEPAAEAAELAPEAAAPEPKPEPEAKAEPGATEAAEAEPPAATETPRAEPAEAQPAAQPASAAPEPAAPPAPSKANPWDEAVAAGTAALEAADPLLAALHYALALRMSPLAAQAVLVGIGDRRDLALELVRVDALRVAAEAAPAEEPAAPEPAAAEESPSLPKAAEQPRHAAPEPPPPIRWE
jgi:hypothetical protein